MKDMLLEIRTVAIKESDPTGEELLKLSVALQHCVALGGYEELRKMLSSEKHRHNTECVAYLLEDACTRVRGCAYENGIMYSGTGFAVAAKVELHKAATEGAHNGWICYDASYAEKIAAAVGDQFGLVEGHVVTVVPAFLSRSFMTNVPAASWYSMIGQNTNLTVEGKKNVELLIPEVEERNYRFYEGRNELALIGIIAYDDDRWLENEGVFDNDGAWSDTLSEAVEAALHLLPLAHLYPIAYSDPNWPPNMIEISHPV